jgi:DNA-binding SARP family transcriptional activator
LDADRHHVRVLGGFVLEGPSREALTTLTQRGEAALAVLAVAGALGCTRERLIGLLWPEEDEASARHNLRDVLYALRRTLGRGPIAGTGEILRLDPARLTSDVQAFGEALAAARLEHAVAAYGGPLLDGFHLSGAPEFERWLELERGRLFRECQHALKRLAKQAENNGHWDAAAEWWARTADADPYNSRAVVRLMVALTRAGDRANAILTAEAHCRLLLNELELEPDAGFVEELDRIRGGKLAPATFFTPPP